MLKDQSNFSLEYKLEYPLTIDAGAGVGLFSVRQALKYPDRKILAIERTHNRFAKLKNRAKQIKSNNLRVVQALAFEWMAEFLADASVAELYLLYPNPWPKKSHAKRRWLNQEAWSLALAKLAPDAKITVASNSLEYLLEAQQRLREDAFETTDLICVNHLQNDSGKNFQARTHFEKKYLARGELCWQIETI